MKAKVLLVLSPEQRPQLLRVLEESGMEVFMATGSREAQQKLSSPSGYDLLLVDAELPDGSWRDLLPFALNSKRTCEMIVCSRCGDERLWAEVVQCGAFDLLVEPYEEREVVRIAQSALDSQYMRRFTRPVSLRAS